MRAAALLLAAILAAPACICAEPPGTDAGRPADSTTVEVPLFFGMALILWDGDWIGLPWVNHSMAVLLRDVPEEPRRTLLFSYDPETGDGCELGQYEDGPDVPWWGDYTSHDVGEILVTGTVLDPLVLTCEDAPNGIGRCWYALNTGDGLLLRGGEILSASAPGGPELGAFTAELLTPELPNIVDPPGAMDAVPVVVIPGESLTLRWVPGNADHVMVWQGGVGAFFCRSDDDGEITIPAALAAGIVTSDVVPFRAINITRVLTREALTEDGQTIRLRAWRFTNLQTVRGE